MSVRIQTGNFSKEAMLKYEIVKSRYRYGLHMHEFIELVISFSGEVNITVDGKCERVSAGHAALVLPYQKHEYTSEDTSELAFLLFPSTLLPELQKSINGMVSDRTTFKLDDITLFAVKNRIFGKEDFSVYDFKGCLAFVLDDYLSQVTLTPSTKKGNMAAEIFEYVHNHYPENITLQSVAQALNYSPKYLSNCIYKLFEHNFSSFVAAIRVDKARYFLRNTDMTIAEVCYACGFGSERTFHRQFKQFINTTPKKYKSGLGKFQPRKYKIFNEY